MPDREKVIKGLEWILNDIYENGHYQVGYYADEIRKAIALLKTQEPSKYEYHIDHTDCPWYISGEESKCPVTCSQYRDGWNDAMNYIYKGGNGYSPYKRR